MDARDEKVKPQTPVGQPGEVAEGLADADGVVIVGAVPAPDEEDGGEDVEGDGAAEEGQRDGRQEPGGFKGVGGVQRRVGADQAEEGSVGGELHPVAGGVQHSNFSRRSDHCDRCGGGWCCSGREVVGIPNPNGGAEGEPDERRQQSTVNLVAKTYTPHGQVSREGAICIYTECSLDVLLQCDQLVISFIHAGGLWWWLRKALGVWGEASKGRHFSPLPLSP